MQSHRFLREADGNVLAVVTLTVAAIFGTIGLAMNPESFDAPQWSAQWSVVASAHAVAPLPDAKTATGPGEASRTGEPATATHPEAAR